MVISVNLRGKFIIILIFYFVLLHFIQIYKFGIKFSREFDDLSR